jgi:hypothetical protein
MPEALPWREFPSPHPIPFDPPSNAMMTVHAIQEKRYRSMQEHIRRAHPEKYISKLPATEESVQLMISTPPSEHPRPSTPIQSLGNSGRPARLHRRRSY